MAASTLAQSVVSGLLAGCVYALIAVGLSLIFGVMDIVNFAHGEYLMLAMYGAFFLWQFFRLDPVVALPLLAVALGLAGALTYQLIIKRVYEAPMLAQVFATFGLSVFLQALAQFLWTPNYRSIQKPLLEGSVRLGPDIYAGRPELTAAVVCVAAFLALYWFLQRTETGVALRATSEDKQTAFLMGIDGDRMFALGWAIGLACVGVAGAMLASFYYVFPTVGGSFGLLAYVAVALGGFGNILGSFLGGAIIGVVEALTGQYVAPAFKYVGVFVVYLLVVTFRPQGLVGRF